MVRQSCWAVMSLQMRSLKEKFRLVQVRGLLMYKDGNKKTFTEFNAEIAEKNYNVGKKERKIEARCCDLRFKNT